MRFTDKGINTAEVTSAEQFAKFLFPEHLRITMKKLACRDVGLDCDFVIEGISVNEVQDKAHQHAFEIHAIKPEEMTSEMKVKIIENILDT